MALNPSGLKGCQGSCSRAKVGCLALRHEQELVHLLKELRGRLVQRGNDLRKGMEHGSVSWYKLVQAHNFSSYSALFVRGELP